MVSAWQSRNEVDERRAGDGSQAASTRGDFDAPAPLRQPGERHARRRRRAVRGKEGEARTAGRYQWLRVIAEFSAGKIIPGVLTLVSIPIWLRQFGPANYALFSLYWTCSLIGTALAVGWLNQAILRNAGNDDMAYERVAWRTRRALEATPIAVVVPLAVLTHTTLRSYATGWGFFAAAAVGLLVNASYLIRQTVAQREVQARAYAVAETARTAVALGFSFLLASSGFVTSWSLVAANAVGTATGLAVLGRRRVGQPGRSETPEAKGIVRRYWNFGWPMSLWLALSSSAMYIDRFFISSLYGLRAAGDYAAAADLVVRGMSILVAPAIMFLHPAFMRSWNTGERVAALHTWRRIMFFLTLATSGVAVATFGGYLVFADVLLKSPPSYAIFGALVIGGVAWQLAHMVHKPLEASNRTGVLLGVLLVSLAATIAADVLLSRPLGILGIAIGFALGAATYIGLVAVLTVPTTRVGLRLEAST